MNALTDRASRPLLILALLVPLSGCGAIQVTALDGAQAGLQTLLDLFLTEVTNDIAESLLNQPPPATDDPDDPPTPPGDAVERGAAFVAAHCAGCHGTDGASGFAPNIQGLTADVLSESLGGAGGHLVITAEPEDIDDLAAYLASF